MLDNFKKNLEEMKGVVDKMEKIDEDLANSSEGADEYNRRMAPYVSRLKTLNDAVPNLLAEIKTKRQLPSESKKIPAPKKKTESFSYVSPSTKKKSYVTLNKEDRQKFLKDLHLSDSMENTYNKKEKKMVVTKPSKIAAISNRLFRNFSESIAPKFSSLSDDLKKANIRFLTSTYISIGLFASLCAFVFGLLLLGFLVVLDFGNLVYAWVPFVMGGGVLFAFYFYPSSEKGAIRKKISHELPFATIHMAAVAGSNIEPTKIFSIIATSKEYPNIGRELRKVINHVQIYGYDLVTALKNVSRQTSTKSLGELFSGLATNISSGGELKSYLSKKADNYLEDYRLERQKYSDIAGTFMDVYISILIAAPLVLMMLFIVMNVSGLAIGLSLNVLLVISVAAVVLANVVFLIVLQIKQPSV